ncbi:MAG: hypothetical protein SOW18_04985 [Peptoniphilus sp.]|nr:hypothetical protein [Peptoniphilus sp.]MDY3118878.1 hypothetical protein [Peptoniphilus sp.]
MKIFPVNFAAMSVYAVNYGASVLPWLRLVLVVIGMASFTYALFSKTFSKSWIVGAAALFLYFVTGILGGAASVVTLLLFLASGVLVLMEAIVPGFGIAGISGVALFFISLILAMDDGVWSFMTFFLSAAAVLLMARGLWEKGGSLPFVQRLVGINSPPAKKLPPCKVGDVGLSYTQLRPEGVGLFSGKEVTVRSSGPLIERNRHIEIVSIHGRNISVKEVS